MRGLTCRGLGLVPSLAERDQPIGAGDGQVRVAVVAGVGQDGADDVIGLPVTVCNMAATCSVARSIG